MNNMNNGNNNVSVWTTDGNGNTYLNNVLQYYFVPGQEGTLYYGAIDKQFYMSNNGQLVVALNQDTLGNHHAQWIASLNLNQNAPYTPSAPPGYFERTYPNQFQYYQKATSYLPEDFKENSTEKCIGVLFAILALGFVSYGADAYVNLDVNAPDAADSALQTLRVLTIGLGSAMAIGSAMWAFVKFDKLDTENGIQNDANKAQATSYRKWGNAFFGLGVIALVAFAGVSTATWLVHEETDIGFAHLVAAPLAAIFFALAVEYKTHYHECKIAKQEYKDHTTPTQKFIEKMIPIMIALAAIGMMGYASASMKNDIGDAETLKHDIQVITQMVGAIFILGGLFQAIQTAWNAHLKAGERYDAQASRNEIPVRNKDSKALIWSLGYTLAAIGAGAGFLSLSLMSELSPGLKVFGQVLSAAAGVSFLRAGANSEMNSNAQWKPKLQQP